MIHSRERNQARAFVKILAWGLLVSLVSGGASAEGERVTLAPEEVTFTSLEQTVTLTLQRGGVPVPAAAIKGMRLLVGTHDYHEMLAMGKSDGAIALTPTRFVEVGSYRLVIETDQGPATAQVYTPLTSLPDTLTDAMKNLELSEQEAKLRLGLAVTLDPCVVDIKIPPVNYEGQALTLSVPPNPTHHFIWSVNGQIESEGAGRNEFTYVFPEPGNFIIGYSEDAGGAPLAAIVRSTKVAALPAVPVDWPVGEELTLRAPEGYSSHEWLIGDKRVGEGDHFTKTYQAPGTETIVCLSCGRTSDIPGTFMKTRYVVNVTARP